MQLFWMVEAKRIMDNWSENNFHNPIHHSKDDDSITPSTNGHNSLQYFLNVMGNWNDQEKAARNSK